MTTRLYEDDWGVYYRANDNTKMYIPHSSPMDGAKVNINNHPYTYNKDADTWTRDA